MHNFCWPLTVLPRGTLQHEHLEEWNNSLEGYAAAVAVAEQVDQPAPISLLHCFISSPSCPPRTGRLFPLHPIADSPRPTDARPSPPDHNRAAPGPPRRQPADPREGARPALDGWADTDRTAPADRPPLLQRAVGESWAPFQQLAAHGLERRDNGIVIHGALIGASGSCRCTSGELVAGRRRVATPVGGEAAVQKRAGQRGVAGPA